MTKQDLIDEYEKSPLKELEMEMFHAEKPWVKMDVPELKDKYKGGRLENWFGWYMSGGLLRVDGEIYNDDRWPDGKIIETSYVVNMEYDEFTKTGILETRNTVYTLGASLIVPTHYSKLDD